MDRFDVVLPILYLLSYIPYACLLWKYAIRYT